MNSNESIAAVLSSESEAAAQIKLFELLAHRTKLYTMGESSSVPIETAEELFKTVCFTVDTALREKGLSPACLADYDLNMLFYEGIKTIEKQIDTVEQLCRRALITMPRLNNIYLAATLKSIATFHSRYFYRDFAHRIPCEIDYLLAVPVSEENMGVTYLVKYMRRLCAENLILSYFDAAAVDRLLQMQQPEYGDTPLNMCEPVVETAVKCVLLDKPWQCLELDRNDKEKLLDKLDTVTVGTLEASLINGAKTLCKSMGLDDAFTRRYLCDIAVKNAQRIRHGVV